MSDLTFYEFIRAVRYFGKRGWRIIPEYSFVERDNETTVHLQLVIEKQ